MDMLEFITGASKAQRDMNFGCTLKMHDIYDIYLALTAIAEKFNNVNRTIMEWKKNVKECITEDRAME